MKVGSSEIFHFECEISTDPDMGRRTYNYDSCIAFAYPERQKRKPVLLRYPNSAVLYLSQGIRAGSKPMDTLASRLYFPPGKLVQTELLQHFPSDIIAENRKKEVEKSLGKLSYVDYLIPAVKVQAYTIKEIQEKRLLIPFMPIRFRPLLKRMEKEKEKEKEQILQKSK